MSVAELQLKLHLAIDTITDSKKLSALNTLIEESTQPFSSMSLKEYIKAIDEARQQIKEGKSSTVDDLEKESEDW
ncbi:MAG: hypothetical protein ACFCUU_02955 [Cyclobacteriaceae bacterium]